MEHHTALAQMETVDKQIELLQQELQNLEVSIELNFIKLATSIAFNLTWLTLVTSSHHNY